MASSFSDPILQFWFGDLDSSGLATPAFRRRWFSGGPKFDNEIAVRFGDRLAQALSDQIAPAILVGDPFSTLANIILLDQFPRNMYRGTARAFVGDPLALQLTRSLVDSEISDLLPLEAKIFSWLPLEHAESLGCQRQMLRLVDELHQSVAPELRPQVEGFRKHAEQHHQIIEQFGRFPHRNRVLERASTAQEAHWLSEQRGSFGQ